MRKRLKDLSTAQLKAELERCLIAKFDTEQEFTRRPWARLGSTIQFYTRKIYKIKHLLAERQAIENQLSFEFMHK